MSDQPAGDSSGDGERKSIAIEWYISPDIQTRVATNFIVQGAPEEFLVSFFEIVPPHFIGTDEEIAEQVEQLTSVRATCVARLLITPARMEGFLQALQSNFERWKEHAERES